MSSSVGTLNRNRDEHPVAVERALARIGTLRPAQSRYTIGEEVFRDDLRICRRVWDATLQREVAMNLLHDAAPGPTGAAPSRIEASTRRFVEEAWIAGQLNHPGVVPIHEMGIDAQGQLFLTTRPIEGRSLAEVIACTATGRDGFTRARVLDALLEVCETVAYAHSRGFVHRRLRPESILLGQFGETYVLDWGSVGDESRARGPDRLTAYLAPEQVLDGFADIGPRTDVYAVGAMLYHLLSGHAPHGDDGTERERDAIVAQIGRAAPTSIRRCARRAPRELIAICEKAMAREPGARFADMNAMAADLRAHIENRVVRAHRTGALAELQKWMLRNRATSIAAVCALVVALGGLSWIFTVTSIKNRALTRARAELQAQLDDVRRLASIKSVRDLARSADELWPAGPARLPAMRRWYDQARALEAERPLHAASLAALIARRDPRSSARSPGFDDPVDAWWYMNLCELLRGLDALREDAPNKVGTLAEMEVRMAQSQSIVQRSIDDHADAWSQAIAAIAEDPRYGGLELSEQIGLVPVGRDPESGYFEFWHVESGSPPARSLETHHLIPSEESGLVLVLLPGGTFDFGSQGRDSFLPNFDPEASAHAVVRQLTLGPFFIAKFEMTQAQWVRAMGQNPSAHRPGSPECSQAHGLLHPVHSISWRDAESAALRLGLELPTSAQWEFAARAGKATIYPTGSSPASLRDAGNLADQSFGRIFSGLTSVPQPWDDGYPCLAPVGRFRPNAFGLHDMVGNVMEFCRDEFMPANEAVDLAPEDGEQHRRAPAAEVMFRISRGGSWCEGQFYASAGLALGVPPQKMSTAYGVRMARAIER